VSGVVAIDGVVVPPEHALVSVYDRGFLYGDAVFEVLRTYAGVPFALAEHMRRLARSAARVLIPMPIDEGAFAAEVSGVIELARASHGPRDYYARIMLTRGSGPLGLDPDLAEHPLRVVLVQPVHPPSREAYAAGIALVTVATKRATDDTAAAGAKVSNYLASLLAVREAKLRGAAEALIVDARGDVVEGASSNVFIVLAAVSSAARPVLVTPPEDAGILPGITRAAVLEVARELGFEVRLERLRAEDLYAAAEVFVTSSIREILAATRVDGHVVGAGVPGPVCRALHRAFRVNVGLGDGPMPWD
jgi:branched-chain amino acid aminotransferase